jgi:hypothetical protein
MVLIENQQYLCEEEKRLKEDRERTAYWKKWGPYTAERQWATGQSLHTVPMLFRLANISQSAKITRKHSGSC